MMRKKLYSIASIYVFISFFGMFSQNENGSAHALTGQLRGREIIDYQRIDTIELFFCRYEQEAQLYLDRPAFKGTPMTGSMMAECARNTYDSTGIIVPLELALSQAQWESGMGRKGKSAKENPYNVGEFDRGTMIKFKSTKQGVQAYYDLIAKDYLNNKTVDCLLSNFINDNGHRYASSKTYEKHIGSTYINIRNWIDGQSDTVQINS